MSKVLLGRCGMKSLTVPDIQLLFLGMRQLLRKRVLCFQDLLLELETNALSALWFALFSTVHAQVPLGCSCTIADIYQVLTWKGCRTNWIGIHKLCLQTHPWP